MRLWFVGILFFYSCEIIGQDIFSLSDCIQIATERNSSVKQARINADIAGLASKASSQAYIPSLSISNQDNTSTGRVLDPTTYQFLSNRTVFDMSAAVGASMTLFSGFDRSQNVKKSKINLQSALLETEKTINNLSLQVTAIFLNIVLDKEAVLICENKIQMLQEQEEFISRKVRHKAATEGDLLNIQADVTNARVELAEAAKNLGIDKVAMCELLQIEDWEHFDISFEEQDEIVPRLWNETDVVSSAMGLPQIRQRELAIDVAERDVRIASASYWPTLKLSGGYGSSFSNARTRNDGSEYFFHDQFKDNLSAYVSLSINIPILSAINVSNTVRQKKLVCSRAAYELEQNKTTLGKEVRQAIINANAAYDKYTLLAADVDKYVEALRHTKEKYDAGAATYYDYSTAVSNLFQARGKRLQSKYEYILRTKIIEFYTGKPIS